MEASDQQGQASSKRRTIVSHSVFLSGSSSGLQTEVSPILQNSSKCLYAVCAASSQHINQHIAFFTEKVLQPNKTSARQNRVVKLIYILEQPPYLLSKQASHFVLSHSVACG